MKLKIVKNENTFGNEFCVQVNTSFEMRRCAQKREGTKDRFLRKRDKSLSTSPIPGPIETRKNLEIHSTRRNIKWSKRQPPVTSRVQQFAKSLRDTAIRNVVLKTSPSSHSNPSFGAFLDAPRISANLHSSPPPLPPTASLITNKAFQATCRNYPGRITERRRRLNGLLYGRVPSRFSFDRERGKRQIGKIRIDSIIHNPLLVILPRLIVEAL